MASQHPTFIHERVDLARRGSHPGLIRRMPSGWAVLGDHQLLEGYSLLLPDPVVGDLTDLDREARIRFLLDMSLLGEALLSVTPAYRMNYEILGNFAPALHAHVTPRYPDEPDELRFGPPGRYPRAQQAATPFSPESHGPLLQSIGAALDGLLRQDDRAGTSASQTRVYVDMVGDLFHAGHVALLKAARDFGDWLIVGLLSDEVASGYKRRPIMSLAERVAVVEACRYVDEVVPDAPYTVTTEFMDEHDISVVVHGDDLSRDSLGEVYGPVAAAGKLQLVSYTKGVSTTEIIRRVRAL